MTFQKILRELLQSTPGAIGAVFLDREGEAVDLWAERIFDIGPEGLRAVGAYQGIFISDAKRLCNRIGAGRVEQMTLEFEHVKLLSCDLKEGYYLVLIVDRGANEGIAWQRLRACRQRLIEEI